eukprot:TRINITY_DN204_c0_g1_i10.p1 TRINITY_DN204_c0_g1~~TRINITY_DN204_c0_g1_i10.p1  ORF type:complete len:254 (+),score=33.48 TRINITY_DN204_c0_g1_i10:891-1652(+)
MIPEGQMFGEIEVLFKCPRLFTAVAISSVRILAIPKKDFFARLSMQVIDDLRRLARKKFRWLLDRAKVLEEQSQEDHKTVGRLQFMSPPEEKSQEVEEKPDPEFIRNWWKGTPGRLWFPKNGTGALDSIIEQENIAYGRAAARVRPPSVVDLINRAPLNALLVNAEQAQQKLAESIATLVMNEEDEFTANTFIVSPFPLFFPFLYIPIHILCEYAFQLYSIQVYFFSRLPTMVKEENQKAPRKRCMEKLNSSA